MLQAVPLDISISNKIYMFTNLPTLLSKHIVFQAKQFLKDKRVHTFMISFLWYLQMGKISVKGLNNSYPWV
jgi:hypothetical protein